MPNTIRRKGHENNPFLAMYDVAHAVSYDLTLQRACRAFLPFVWEDTKSENTNYATIKRYLIDYWTKDGRPGAHPDAWRKLRRAIDAVRPESGRFLRWYGPENNALVQLLQNQKEEGPSLGAALLAAAEAARADKKTAPFPKDRWKSYLAEREYGLFLFELVCSLLDPAGAPAERAVSELDRLILLLEENHTDVGQLRQYAESGVLRQNKSGTYGILETLHRAGEAYNIRKDADLFTLLDASDIYYYHRVGKATKETRKRNLEWAYRYSKAAFDRFENRVAAWNLGYTWYQHEDAPRAVLAELDALPVTGDPQEFSYLRAFHYFCIAADKGLADAHNSLGNLCERVMLHTAEYPQLVDKIKSRFRGRLLSEEGKTKSDFADDRAMVRASMRLCYRHAAEGESLTGMQNYYNLLLKEMFETTGCRTLTQYKALHADRIFEIQKYLTKLADYRIPTALTDMATLCLHMHSLNEYLEESALSQSGNPLRLVPYDLIFPFYAKRKNGLREARLLLEEAAEMTIENLMSPWPAFYLSRICYENREYEEALSWIERTADRSSYEAVTYKKKQKDLFAAQRDLCLKALKSAAPGMRRLRSMQEPR